MELDSKILTYIAYRASRSVLINQLNEIRLTVEAISEVIKRLDISADAKSEVDMFFKQAKHDFGRQIKELFEKAKAEKKEKVIIEDLRKPLF